MRIMGKCTWSPPTVLAARTLHDIQRSGTSQSLQCDAHPTASSHCNIPAQTKGQATATSRDPINHTNSWHAGSWRMPDVCARPSAVNLG